MIYDIWYMIYDIWYMIWYDMIWYDMIWYIYIYGHKYHDYHDLFSPIFPTSQIRTLVVVLAVFLHSSASQLAVFEKPWIRSLSRTERDLLQNWSIFCITNTLKYIANTILNPFWTFFRHWISILETWRPETPCLISFLAQVCFASCRDCGLQRPKKRAELRMAISGSKL